MSESNSVTRLLHYTQGQLAATLNISERSLERMRAEGSGPLFRKAGRRVLYKVEDVEAWLAGRSFSSTAEAKEAGVR